MNSLMSKRVIASLLQNRKSASTLAVSVLPTPVGPRKRKEPMGRFEAKPALLRWMTSAMVSSTARWPTMCWLRKSRMPSTRSASLMSSRSTGMRAISETTSAMSAGSTDSLPCRTARAAAVSIRLIALSGSRRSTM